MNNEGEEEQPKKRGRKPKIKNPEDDKPKEKKKRGRKPKVKELVDDKPKEDSEEPRIRKRGRKPKYPIESISDIRAKFKGNDKVEFSNTNNTKSVDDTDYNKTQVSFGNFNITVIEKPEIDKEELRNMFKIEEHENFPDLDIHEEKENNDEDIKYNDTSIYNKITISNNNNNNIYSESESEFESIPVRYCQNCEDKKKLNNLVKVRKREIHHMLYEFNKERQEYNQWPNKTNILCWWCCHTFNDVPIPSVNNFDYNRNTYSLKGIFCSWECSLSYTLEYNKTSSYLYKFYRDITGNLNFNIKKAPSRYILKNFGGYMDINEYRNSFHKNRDIMIASDNKLDYVNQEILEVYEELEQKNKKKNKKKKKYVKIPM